MDPQPKPDTIQVTDRATGETRSAAPLEAQQAFLEGKAGLPAGSMVPLTKEGRIGDFPAEKLQDALKAGWNIAGHSDFVKDDARKDETRSAAEGMLRSLTIGTSDLAAKAFSSPEDFERYQARAATPSAEMGEWAGTGATLVGGIVGVAGKSLAARALGTALAPTEALGAAVSTRVAARMGAAGAGSGLSKAVGLAAAGASEGAIYGGGMAMSEAALGDPKANAETILAAGGMGALWGAGIGAAGGAVLGAVGAGVEHLAARRAAKAAEPLTDDLEALLRSNGIEAADKTVVQRASIAMADSLGYDKTASRVVNSKRGAAILAEGEEALEHASTRLGQVVSEVTETAKAAAQNARAAKQGDWVRSAVREMDPEVAVESTRNVVGSLREKAAQLRAWEAEGLAPEGSAMAAAIEKRLDAVTERVFKASKIERVVTETVEDVDRAGRPVTREVKRVMELDDLVNRYQNVPDAAVTAHTELSAVVEDLAKMAKGNKTGRVAEAVSDMSRIVDSSLDTAEHWGEAATRRAGLTQDVEAFMAEQTRLTHVMGLDAEGKLSPSAARKLVADMVNDGSVTNLEDNLRALVDRHRRLTDEGRVAKDVFGVKGKPDASGVVRGADAIDADIRGLAKDLKDRVVVWNAVGRLRRERGAMMAGASNFMSYALGGAVGELSQAAGTPLSGMGLGLAAGGAFTAITDPARSAMLRSRLGAVLSKQTEKLKTAVTGLVSGVAASHVTTGAVAKTTATILEASSPQERSEAFEKRITEVQSLADSPDPTDAVAALGKVAPDHASAVMERHDVALRLLLGAIPQPVPSDSGLYLKKPLYTDRAMVAFARLDRAIQDPTSIIEDARAGVVTPEARKVLELVYPKLREQILSEVANREPGAMSRETERAIQRLVYPTSPQAQQRTRVIQQLFLNEAAQPAPGSQRGRARRSSSVNTRDLLSAMDRLDQ